MEQPIGQDVHANRSSVMQKSELTRAIESLDSEIAALQAMRARLLALKVKVAQRPQPRAAKTTKAEGAA
jgi:hypothetical protein